MQCNVGKTDRTLRVVAGVVILGAGVLMQQWWGAVGLIPLLTGLFKWCPLYIPLGISTNK